MIFRRYEYICRSEQFSEDKTAEQIHGAMIKEYCGPGLAGHVSRDSAEIDAREKPVRKETEEPDDTLPKRKRGRPEKGEAVQPSRSERLKKTSRIYRKYAMPEQKKTVKGTKPHGTVTGYILTQLTEIFR